MNIKQLAAHLAPFSVQTRCLSTPTQEMLGVYVLQGSSLPGDPQLIYLCTQAQFEALPQEVSAQGCYVLYQLRTAVTLPREDVSALNLFLLSQTEEIQEVYDCLSIQFSQTHKVSIAMKPMLDALFSNLGMQHLIDVSYKVLRNPIFVSDTSGKYIANAFDENSFDEDGRFARFILSDILNGYIDDGGQNFIREHKIFENLSKDKRPYEFFHPTFNAPVLLCHLRVHDAIIGTIKMYAIEHPFTELDRKLFPILAEIAAQELQRDGRSLNNQTEKSSRFLIDLVTSSHANEEMLNRCNTLFKITPSHQFSFAVSAQSSNPSMLSIYWEQIKALFPASPSAIYGGRILLLLSQNEAAPDAIEFAVSKLEHFATQRRLPFGVSYLYDDLKLSRESFELARCAVNHGQKHLPEQYIIRFKDIILPELFHGYQQSGKLARLIMPEIHALIAYDAKQGSDYAHTLEVYLNNMGKSQAVCNELHIHKNTLLYRLNRLEELWGIDLSSGDVAFRAYLSFKTLEYLKHLND